DESVDNYVTIAAYMDDQQKNAELYEGMGFARKTNEAIYQTLRFGMDIIGGAPAAKLAKEAIEKRVGQTVRGRIASEVGGEAARMASPGLAKMVAEGAIDRMAPAGLQEGDGFLEAASKSFGSQMITQLAERAGGLIQFRTQAARAIGRDPASIATAAEWNGIFAELGEERLDEIMNGIFSGVTGDGFEFGATGDILSGDPARQEQALEQLAVEAASIGAIGAPGAISGALRRRLERTAEISGEDFQSLLNLAENQPEQLSRLEQLTQVRDKKFVSSEDATNLGLSEEDSKSRKTRMAAVEREILQIQEMARDARETQEEEPAQEAEQTDAQTQEPERQDVQEEVTEPELTEDQIAEQDLVDSGAIGINADGEPIFEDENGVRSVGGFNEPVEIRPARGPNGGVVYQPVVNVDQRENRFKTEEERNQPGNLPENVPAPQTDDQGFAQFPEQMQSLGIPRADMPQVTSEQRGALANFARARGVDFERVELLPTNLRPSQAEYSPEKVDKARGYDGPERAILVSSDNYVVDGHHQWMKNRTDTPGEPMEVVRLGAPANEAIDLVREFPSSETSDESGQATQPDLPDSEPDSVPDTTDPEQLRAMTPEQVEQVWRNRTPNAPRFAPGKSEMIRDIVGQMPAPSQQGTVRTSGTGREVMDLSPQGIPEVGRVGAEAVLDGDNESTGWLRKETPNGVLLIHPTEDRYERFESPDPKNGTAVMRARAEATIFANKNPVQQAAVPQREKGGAQSGGEEQSPASPQDARNKKEKSSTEELSDMDKAMQEQVGDLLADIGDELGLTKPKAGAKKKRAKKKAAKKRTTKAGAKKTRISKAADKARSEAAQARKDTDDFLDDLIDQFRGQVNVGLDPKLLASSAKYALMEISTHLKQGKAQALTFAEFVENAVQRIPADVLDRMIPYLESAWREVHRRGFT
ncbi:MAG: hypothetical protein AAGG44_15845, partial [Planctomycetota bacterium]